MTDDNLTQAAQAVVRHGPYVTTENFEKPGKHRGRIHFKNPRFQQENVRFVDLRVENVDGEVIELRRVEIGKLRSMCIEADATAVHVEKTDRGDDPEFEAREAHRRADALAQRRLGGMDPGPKESMDAYTARMKRAETEFRRAFPEWKPEVYNQEGAS